MTLENKFCQTCVFYRAEINCVSCVTKKKKQTTTNKFTIRVQLRANRKFCERSKLPQHEKHFIGFNTKLLCLSRLGTPPSSQAGKPDLTSCKGKGKMLDKFLQKKPQHLAAPTKTTGQENYCKGIESYKQLCPMELCKAGHITCILPALQSGENTNKTTRSARVKMQ